MAGGCLGFLYESKPEHRRFFAVFALAVGFYVATVLGRYYGSVAKILVAYQVKHFDSLSILSAIRTIGAPIPNREYRRSDSAASRYQLASDLSVVDDLKVSRFLGYFD